MDVYIDYLNCATQVDVRQQHLTSDLTLRYLKEIFPSLPSNVKDSISLEKGLQGDVDWAQTKEIIGCHINTQDGTLRLPFKRLE